MTSPSASPRRALPRWLLPVAAGLLLAGGLLLLRGRPAATPAVGSSEVPSATPPSAAASFTLSIDSEPSGASVSEGSVRLGVTPFSLTLELPDGAGPRAFVVEKDGYQPYVVRQGAAHGQVRVMAALSPKLDAPAAAAPPPAAAPAPLPKPTKPHAPAPKPAASPAKPQSDIRLER